MNHNTTREQPSLNGIDVEQQSQTIATIGGNPGFGEVRFQAENQWMGGTRTRSRITAFRTAGTRCPHSDSFAVETDLPVGFQGTDQAPAPTEHALQALAACMTTTLVYNCAARGIEVRSVEAEVQGEMNSGGFLQTDESVRRGFARVGLRFHIDADAPGKELRELLQASPLFDVFTNGVPVDVELGRMDGGSEEPPA